MLTLQRVVQNRSSDHKLLVDVIHTNLQFCIGPPRPRPPPLGGPFPPPLPPLPPLPPRLGGPIRPPLPRGGPGGGIPPGLLIPPLPIPGGGGGCGGKPLPPLTN